MGYDTRWDVLVTYLNYIVLVLLVSGALVMLGLGIGMFIRRASRASRSAAR